MIGRTIGNYRVTAEIGRGGMGAVYLGEHPIIGRRVAIKLLHGQYGQDSQMVARFFKEAKAAHQINNPHIVEVFDFGEFEGAPYLVMEWLSGRSLAAFLREQSVPPLEQALHILSGVGEALGAAHAAGIVHRDLKPDNIFLTKRNDDPLFVKVLDFGLAKVLTADQLGHLKTQSNIIMGTPSHMSPEQCHGDNHIVDARSDVYALGVIAFELVTGRHPFNTTASVVTRTSGGSACLVWLRRLRLVTTGTTGQPRGDDTGDGETEGNEGVREVPLRPRARANRLDAPIWARGKNAALAQPR